MHLAPLAPQLLSFLGTLLIRTVWVHDMSSGWECDGLVLGRCCFEAGHIWGVARAFPAPQY